MQTINTRSRNGHNPYNGTSTGWKDSTDEGPPGRSSKPSDRRRPHNGRTNQSKGATFSGKTSSGNMVAERRFLQVA